MGVGGGGGGSGGGCKGGEGGEGGSGGGEGGRKGCRGGGGGGGGGDSGGEERGVEEVDWFVASRGREEDDFKEPPSRSSSVLWSVRGLSVRVMLYVVCQYV
ncbi:hypothetical protein FHG87_021275 [Trinorchestia longiramus]|nr:hypothetical protein FHG87_021275 [Trinorchestia longiramus]